MPYCGNCGKKFSDHLKFCPHCGEPNALLSEKIDNTAIESKPFPEQTSSEFVTQMRSDKQVYGVVNLENLPAGHIIDERYEIKEKLGQGGFGAVYLAHDQVMGIDKALKIIPEAVSSDKEAMFDLQQEARTMIALNHPNIVRVYDFHNSGNIKYIDMEYVDGKTLSEIKLEYPDKCVPEERVKELAIKIAKGMAYAHESNVLHKDIKPQNIKVNSKGEIKIMDFGIAETVRTSMSRLQSSSASGTLVYMSPEQIRGWNVGKESDIYSFGIVLYDLLCGHPPFYKGDIRYQIINEDLVNPECISDSMYTLIDKCLVKNYKERIASFNLIITYFTDFSSKIEDISNKTKDYEDEIIDFSAKDSDLENLKKGSVKIKSDVGGQPIYLNNSKTEFVTPHIFENLILGKDYIFQIDGDYFSEVKIISVSSLELIEEKFKVKKKEFNVIKELPKCIITIFISLYVYFLLITNYVDNVIVGNILTFIIIVIIIFMVSDFNEKFKKYYKKNGISQLAKVKIITHPKGCSIFFNGRLQPKLSTLRMDYIAGDYLLEIQKDGYEAYSKKIFISNSSFNKFNIILKSIMGSVEVLSEIDNLKIYLNGKETQYKTPHVFENIIPNKEYTIQIKDIYRSDVREFILKPKQPLSIELPLKKSNFKLLKVSKDLIWGLLISIFGLFLFSYNTMISIIFGIFLILIGVGTIIGSVDYIKKFFRNKRI